MLIILEGPDGVGKTTLARQLHDELLTLEPSSVVTIRHAGVPSRHPLDEYVTPLLDYRPGKGNHLILDRWHLGEYVYPRLLNRKTEMDDAVWWYVNQYVYRLGGVVVLCERREDGIEEVYRERGELELLPEYMLTRKLFRDAANGRAIAYDWTGRLCGRVNSTRHIIQTAQICESYVKPFERHVTYVGRVQPKFLLFGDVRHKLDLVKQSLIRSDRRPAFMPYRATSGHWLLNAVLGDDGLREDAALANACDVDDPRELWRDLGEPKAVSLGKMAHIRLLGCKIPHGRVPHPQYARRFFSDRQDSYVAAIYDALENQEDHSKWRGSLKDATAVRSTAKSSTL